MWSRILLTFFIRRTRLSLDDASRQGLPSAASDANQPTLRLEPRGYTAAEVIARERAFISGTRPEVADNKPLIGLALSGGGIRSASINLGILQELAQGNVLQKIAYLSTVSGGGYIGSWLTAWASRVGFEKVCKKLSGNRRPVPAQADSAGSRNDPHFFEPDPVHWLRKYTTYLTPRSGLLSRDTWTAIGIYLRNLFLNQALLLAWMFVALCLLQLLAFAYRTLSLAHTVWPRWPTLIAGALFLVTIAARAQSWWQFERTTRTNKADGDDKRLDFPAFFWIAGCIASAVLLSFALTPISKHFGSGIVLQQSPDALTPISKHFWPDIVLQQSLPATSAWRFAVAGALVVSIGSALVWAYVRLRRRQPASQQKSSDGAGSERPLAGVISDEWHRRVLATPAAGAVAGFLLYACWRLFQLFRGDTAAHLTVLAVPLIVISFVLTSFVHIGLMGLEFPDAKREWLGSAAGILLKVALIWSVVAALAIYGPHLVALLLSMNLGGWKKTADVVKVFLPGGWAAAVIAGLLAAYSSKTGTPGSRKPIDWLAKLAPPLFLAGVLVILSSVLTRVYQDRLPGSWRALPEGFLFNNLMPKFWLVLGISAAVGTWLLFVLDVNEFSMHLFYRNRLVRAYLGASNQERHPHPFTKFAVNDDVFLADLGMSDNWVTRDKHKQQPYDGPYPLICTALNLVGGAPLEWQERRATSFIYSPLFCGYDKLPPGPEAKATPGYRPTRICSPNRLQPDLGFSGELGPHLGTAMAASGAAASPNMGYHSSPFVAALMTVFNVRLGWWVGNPGIEGNKWTEYGPKSGRIFYELFSHTDDDGSYVYLSDGGHFENLAIYELVRRRVPLIIACDAAQDGDFSFSDLGKAIEKCRRDFGAEIEIDISAIERKKGSRFNGSHFVVGKITYRALSADDSINPILKDFGDVQHGWLLYIKSSLTGDEPEDVLAHRKANPLFPHDPTANQFFTESKFESYRRLGEDIARHTLNTLQTHTASNCEGVIKCVRRYFEGSQQQQPAATGVVESIVWSRYQVD